MEGWKNRDEEKEAMLTKLRTEKVNIEEKLGKQNEVRFLFIIDFFFHHSFLRHLIYKTKHVPMYTEITPPTLIIDMYDVCFHNFWILDD